MKYDDWFVKVVETAISTHLEDEARKITEEILEKISKELRVKASNICSQVVIETFNTISFENFGPTLKIIVNLPEKSK